jgi:hypothetical protein
MGSEFDVKDPLVIDRIPVVEELPIVRPLLVKDHAPPTPLNEIFEFIVLPPEFIVLPVVVELKVIVPLMFHTVPASNDIDPRMLRAGDVPCANVTVPADTVMSRQFKVPVMVTV